MILSGHQIKQEVDFGDINITPYDEGQINPASYDLRLGKGLVRYKNPVLDMRKDNQISREEIGPNGFLLHPGELYLMHTEETIHTNSFVPVIDGKSSIGRLGICVHLTAGYGDPGFNGQYTLEVSVVKSVIVYPGVRFCQVRFHKMWGAKKLYNGRYIGEASQGAVPSASWKQMLEEDMG